MTRAPAAAAVLAGALVLPAHAGDLPRRAADILFVGDSVTAGVHFMALDDSSAAQAWPAEVAAALGFALPAARFPRPYPLDFRGLAREGLGPGGWRFPWNALPILKPRLPRFRAGEPRPVVAVPGETLGEFLRLGSGTRQPGSTGWIFGAMLLPDRRTALEVAMENPDRPAWVLAFLGANDLLAHFGIVGEAAPPSPADFASDLAALARGLRAAMAPAAPPAQLLLSTLPEVTALPFLQPVPAGARDADGHPFPPGTKASAFLLPYRTDRFEADETWSPAELAVIRAGAAAYNNSVRALCAREGYTVLDIGALLDRLAADPAFATPRSPYFSPDLHHPSSRTHRAMAALALDAMAHVAGVPAPPLPEAPHPALPSAADLDAAAQRRADALMRVTLLGMETGEFPPGPTWRGAVEVAGAVGPGRLGDATFGALLAIDSSPGPFSTRWLSRGTLAARVDAASDRDGDLHLGRRAAQVRAGLALEPLGAWRWTRLEAGWRADVDDAAGWYARAEHRGLLMEAGSDTFAPRELRLGLRWGGTRGRPGHQGN